MNPSAVQSLAPQSWVMGAFTALGVIVILLVFVAAGYRRKAFVAQSRAQYWHDAYRLGRRPIENPRELLKEIFRPLGVPCPCGDSPCANVDHADALRMEREARRHHALDHRHHRIGIELPDATNDSEAAREILSLCVGGLETEGGE